MNADFTIRPGAFVAPAETIRSVAAEQRGAVATELPPEQAVAAPPSTNANQSSKANPGSDGQTRQTLFDPVTAQVIYRVVDSDTKRVLRQVPDQAMLRLRAYSRALDNAIAAQEIARNQPHHTDHTA